MTSTPLRFHANPDALATRVGEEIVLVHLTTDRIYVLNRTGARIWNLMTEGCDREGMRLRMLAEFEVVETDLDRQLDDILVTLEREQLIATSSTGDRP